MDKKALSKRDTHARLLPLQGRKLDGISKR